MELCIRIALVARFAVPEIFRSLIAHKISTAAHKSPRCICHRQRSVIWPKAGALWAALHPDTLGIIQDIFGKSNPEISSKNDAEASASASYRYSIVSFWLLVFGDDNDHNHNNCNQNNTCSRENITIYAVFFEKQKHLPHLLPPIPRGSLCFQQNDPKKPAPWNPS